MLSQAPSYSLSRIFFSLPFLPFFFSFPRNPKPFTFPRPLFQKSICLDATQHHPSTMQSNKIMKGK
ncbi:hypothetical protein Fmac_005383 [Flemingia macrophylla]|uniref:Uncharacterized protein n=1 Tax=Flemingia macrophylla TaxID=520843 RepID=A0ABD1N7K5_9FABA